MTYLVFFLLVVCAYFIGKIIAGGGLSDKYEEVLKKLDK